MPTFDAELMRLWERAEVAADESRGLAVPPEVRAELAAGCEPLGDAVLTHAANADILVLNRVVGFGVPRPATEAQLDRAIARFAELGAKRFMLTLAPGAEPAQLVAWLEARGFYDHNYWIRLSRDASPAPDARSDLRIAPLEPAHATDAGRIIADAFGFSEPLVHWTAALVGLTGWHLFGAFDGDRLAGVAGLYQHDDVAWFGMAATRQDYRGRGAQSALIAKRIDVAHALGCRWLTTETAADTQEKPNPSTHNMRRMGFADAYQRSNWVKVLRE